MSSDCLPRECDVVVVGAGMGGLTCAALLAKAGLKVCLLEMNSRPGGYLVGFERQGFRFDTAIHWLNQCGPRGSVRRVLDFLAPGSPETPPMRRIRRYKGESFDYLLTDRPDDLRDQLLRDHPEDAKGTGNFFAAARRLGFPLMRFGDFLRSRETQSLGDILWFNLNKVRHGLPFLRYLTWSSEKGLSKFFRSEGVKRLFCSEADILSCLVPIGWAYAGDFQLPPRGGSGELSRWLAANAESSGAMLACGCRVTEVLLDGRRAVGVRVQRSGQEAEIRSRYVVGCCDLLTLFEKALPPGTIEEGYLAKLRNADLYDSSVTISIGLDMPPQELGFGEELVFLTRDDVGRKDHNSGNPEKAGISILAPSLRDPSLAPSGKGTLTLFTSASLGYGDAWKTEPGLRRGKAYRDFKQQYAATIVERVEKALAPGLRKHIEVCDVATPVTYWRHTGNRGGTIMAQRPTSRNIRAHVARYLTPVENLILGGQWAEIGGGVPVAVRAGTNAALIVMQRERPRAFEVVKGVVDAKVDPREAQVQEFMRRLAPTASTAGTRASG